MLSGIFAFGYFAKLKPTGRLLAATPAMMTAAEIGPILSGSLVEFFGYSVAGYPAAVIGFASFLCFRRLTTVAPSVIKCRRLEQKTWQCNGLTNSII